MDAAAVKNKLQTRDLSYIAIFVALMAVCAWIAIPITIPFTLQTMGVFLAVGVLGGRRGTLAVLSYLLLGAIGAPVFSGFAGGIGALLRPTGGYLIGFLFAALVMWAAERLFGRNLWVLGISMVLGMVVYYVFGTAWFMVLYTQTTGAITLMAALTSCVFPYILPDLVKAALALTLTATLRRVVK